jgi:fibronectin type 3 domain-containing protein
MKRALFEAGYTRIAETAFYSYSPDYGWTSTLGLSSRDRGAPDDLRKDLVQSMTEHTFNVDLADGDYEVTVVIGDQSYMHDLIDVYAEGNLVINDLTVAGGMFQEVTFSVSVSDEQLSLMFSDGGGVDSNWVINSLSIRMASA